MDQNRNAQNPDREKDRNRPDQGAGGKDDQTIGQQRDRSQGGDRDVNDVSSGSRNKNPGDRSSGSGGSQTNR